MKKGSLSPQAGMILFVCWLGLLTAGCGKKAPPRPPRAPHLQAVKDLQAVVFESGVRLAWSVPVNAEGVDRFELYRSKPDTAKEACPACPRAYELLKTIDVKFGQTHFQLLDRNIDAEGRYYYRVIPLDNRSRPGPDSNEAEVMVKWRQDAGTK